MSSWAMAHFINMKIFNPTRDPEKKIGAKLNGIPGLVCLWLNLKNPPLARNDTVNENVIR